MPPRKDEWERLRAIADAAELRLRKYLLQLVANVANQALERKLVTLIRSGNLLEAIHTAASQFELSTAELETVTGNELLALVQKAGGIAGETLSGQITARFDLTNPASVEWARNHSSEFVRTLNADTRAALQTAVTRSFTEGIPPREAARRLRQAIGLGSREVQAISNYRATLDKLTGRDSLGDLPPSVREKLQRGNVRITKGKLPVDRVERAVDAYRDRLLKERALTLVRTETMSAANEGQQQLWRQAIDRGLLDEAKTRRKWIVTPDDRLCPVCRPMAGQQRRVDETFQSPYNGATAQVPPIHMNCRCAVGLVFKRKAS